jgi:hypothetical protein
MAVRLRRRSGAYGSKGYGPHIETDLSCFFGKQTKEWLSLGYGQPRAVPPRLQQWLVEGVKAMMQVKLE